VKKKILVGLAVEVMLLGVTGISEASLSTIGTAAYNENSYNLIYDNDSPFGSIVWLDYSNAKALQPAQVAWANSLNSASAVTVNLNPGYSVTWTSNWRLPTSVSASVDILTYNGSTGFGYNNTSSEYGHLFYTELKNKGYYDTNGISQSGYGLVNKGDFNNLQAAGYWSGTPWPPVSGANWAFGMDTGWQSAGGQANNNYFFGMAVRSGHVETSPVPIPGTALLLGSSLTALAGLRSRRKKL
jgi:hypothetical protein